MKDHESVLNTLKAFRASDKCTAPPKELISDAIDSIEDLETQLVVLEDELCKKKKTIAYLYNSLEYTAGTSQPANW